MDHSLIYKGSATRSTEPMMLTGDRTTHYRNREAAIKIRGNGKEKNQPKPKRGDQFSSTSAPSTGLFDSALKKDSLFKPVAG
jgi:hypothetical protein